MKILISNHFLRNYSGSELFTFSLAKELRSLGHNVFVFSNILGKVSDELKAIGIPVSNNTSEFENERFDIIHVQHNSTICQLEKAFPLVPKVFMAHGTVPRLEQPFGNSFCEYLAVSEGVKKHLMKWHGVTEKNITVARNFIDGEKFQNRRPVNDIPKKLLVLSNRSSAKNNKLIKEVCLRLGLIFEHVGLPENPVRDVAKCMNEADIVVSVGRGALEAMACERNVLVLNLFGGDGMVTKNNFYDFMRNNFSGRTHWIKYNHESLALEIKKYNPAEGKKLRALVLRENSKEKNIKTILETYGRCTKNGSESPAKNEPVLLSLLPAFWYFREKYYNLKSRI
jgi:O-antigen biosynthesis protein